MIDYICEFQNKYVYAHLFEFNLVDLLRKEVQMTRLFNSSVFNYTFDFDEWPATNPDTSKILAPYNKSIFKIRNEYADVYNRQFMADEKVEEMEENSFVYQSTVLRIPSSNDTVGLYPSNSKALLTSAQVYGTSPG